MTRLLQLSLVATVAFAACKKGVLERPIDSNILVQSSLDDGNVLIECETEKSYPTIVNRIDYSDSKLGKTINIRFKSILATGMLDAIGPAAVDVDLGTLDQGEYTVNFKLNGETTEATLTVGDTVALEMSTGGNVRLM